MFTTLKSGHIQWIHHNDENKMMLLYNVSQLDGHMKDAADCGMIGDGRLGTLTLCDHGQQGRAIEHGGQEGTDRNRMTVHVGMVCWVPLFVFVWDRQHYQNASAHCNSGRLLLRSPMGHLRLYIYGSHDEVAKQRNMRLGWGWDKGVRKRKGG